MSKTACPITREQFSTGAPISISATFAKAPFEVPMKEFSTGSLGWYGSGKVIVTVDGKPCQVQLAITATIIGSKELA